MKRIGLTMVVALTLALLASAHSRTPHANSQAPQANSNRQLTKEQGRAADALAKIATENRLNRYFQSAVTPKLRNCWARVKGEGRIAIGLTYTKTGSSWTWEKLGVTSSTLPRGQDAVALQCVQESVRATSFPVEKGDTGAGKFLVNWSFLVPLPANASIALAKAAGGGSGSAGSCWGCAFDTDHGNFSTVCVAKSQGKQGCVELEKSGCVPIGLNCGSGGYIGVSGGSILMR